MKKLATKLTPAIKAWIKEEFMSDYYENDFEDNFFCFPNFTDENGFKIGSHINGIKGYKIVTEQEFLAEFGKKVEYQIFIRGEWRDTNYSIRLKPQLDYSQEIEALQQKANQNGMKAVVTFEKL